MSKRTFTSSWVPSADEPLSLAVLVQCLGVRVNHGGSCRISPLFYVEIDWTSDAEVDFRRLRSARNCILIGRRPQEYSPYFRRMPGSTVAARSCVSLWCSWGFHSFSTCCPHAMIALGNWFLAVFGVYVARGVDEYWILLEMTSRVCFHVQCLAWSDSGDAHIPQSTAAFW